MQHVMGMIHCMNLVSFYDLIVYMDYLIGRLYSKTLRFQQQILINHLLISMNTYLYLPLQNR